MIILLSFICLFGLESYGQKTTSFSYTGIERLPIKNASPEQLHAYLLNHGYPFASITLSEVVDSNHTVWEIHQGPLVSFDSLIEKQSLVHYKTLCRLLHLSPGEAFSQKEIEIIPLRLQKIPGVKSCGNLELFVESSSFSLAPCLTKAKSNRVEALIGINNNAVTGKPNLTGNLDLKLENIAHLAETFELNWKRPYPNSQSFYLAFSSPFTFGLPIGFAAQFQSFLKDSTFATGNFNFQLLTAATAQEGLVLYTQRTSATSFQSLANYGNTKAQLYGLKQSNTWIKNKAQFYSTFDLAYGNRIIEENGSNATKKVTKFSGSVQYKSRWNSRWFLNLNSTFQHIQSDSLFTNELIRLGGTQSLRGFMDESIYTSSYLLHSGNLGLNLGPDFQVYALFDYASLYKPTRQNLVNPGVGVKLIQGNSAVNLTYAIGNMDQSGIQFRNGRIGVSLVSSF